MDDDYQMEYNESRRKILGRYNFENHQECLGLQPSGRMDDQSNGIHFFRTSEPHDMGRVDLDLRSRVPYPKH